MTKLENLREKFADMHENFDKFLAEHADIVDGIIDTVGEMYKAFKGHEKMEFAIAATLEAIQIPAPFAIMASQIVVDKTEAFIQERYNEKHAQ